VIVTPTWQSQPWYPILLQLSIDHPELLPMNPKNPSVSNGGTSPANPEQYIISGRVEGLRRSYSTMGISQEVKDLLLGSWKSGTQSSYDCAWKKCHGWWISREIDPFSASMASVLNSLAWMFSEGYQYRTINVHRSEISSVLPYIDGFPVGQFPLVKQLFRGILQKKTTTAKISMFVGPRFSIEIFI
jgi:hypothetical protein